MTTELLRLAVENLGANKARSVLTMLGLVIGVAAIVAIVGLGHGASAAITGELGCLGTDLLWAYPRPAGDMPRTEPKAALSLADLPRILAAAPAVRTASPVLSYSETVRRGTTARTRAIIAVGPTYANLRSLAIDQGRFFNEAEAAAQERVAVLGANMAELFFGRALAVGKAVHVGGWRFTVVGVLEKAGGTFVREEGNDDAVFIPYTTAQRLTGEREVPMAFFQSVPGLTSEAKAQIAAALDRLHGAGRFEVGGLDEAITAVSRALGVLTLFVAGVAGVALVVGGVGIMNMMLATVMERTREIGLRKAVGAEPGDILRQFATEALLLALFGGVLGVGLGSGAAALVSSLASMPFIISPATVTLGLGLAVGVGLAAGVYPACRAARLDPVQALRCE